MESSSLPLSYPPHVGHHHLIDTALRNSDHVDVLVVDNPGEKIVWVVFPVPPAVEGVDEEDGVEDSDKWDVFMPVKSDSDDVEDDP